MIKLNIITSALTAVAFTWLAFAVPAGAADASVKIDNFTFGPQELKVKAGTTVTWENGDDIPHTIVSINAFRSKVLDTEGTYSYTFATPGTYKYFCSLHPHMTGTVIVEAATGDAEQPAPAGLQKAVMESH
jgi:plastocyanin